MKKIKVSARIDGFPTILNQAEWIQEGEYFVQIISNTDHNFSYYKMLFSSTGTPYTFEPIEEKELVKEEAKEEVKEEAKEETKFVRVNAEDLKPATQEDLDRLHAAMAQVDKETEQTKTEPEEIEIDLTDLESVDLESVVEVTQIPNGDMDKRPVKKEGFIGSYVHANGRIGVLVKVYTITDFAARTDELKTFAKNVAIQVAAMGTDELLNQEFIKDPRDIGLEAPSVTMKDVLDKIRKDLGEKVEIGSVIRFEL